MDILDTKYHESLVSPRQRWTSTFTIGKLSSTDSIRSLGLVELDRSNQDAATTTYEVLQYHPLLEQLILENLIGFLDIEHQKISRLVCRQWKDEVDFSATQAFPILIEENADLLSFLELIKNPNAEFPVSRVTISNWDNAENNYKDLTELLETVGDSIKLLTLNCLNDVRLKRFPFEKLSFLCSNLIALDINFEFPFVDYTGNEELWKKVEFHCLKHFCIKQVEPLQDYLAGQFVIWVLESAPNLITFAMTDFTAVTTDLVTKFLAQRPQMQRLQNLKMDVSESTLKHWLGVPLNLRNLNISKLDDDVSTKTLSKILEAMCRTLVCLTIKENDFGRDNKQFQLVFPCEMVSLEFVRINDGVSGVHGGSVSLLKRLPKIKHLFLYTNEELEENDQKFFWNGMFHDRQNHQNKKPDAIVRKDLKYFRVYVRLEDMTILRDIKVCFPALTVLKLEINGNLLSEVLHVLKDLKIEDFSLSYSELDGGILAFDSAMTGIQPEECSVLLQDEADAHRHDNLNMLKVHSSFGDWKYLQRLSMFFTPKENVYEKNFTPLDRIAISQGLEVATTIRVLMLRNFKIDERLIQRMLKKMSLNGLMLACCQVIIRPPETLNDKIDSIRERFPDVQFESFNLY